jgi:putative protease
LRRPENADAQVPNPTLTFHDNVANRLARKLYTDHGAESVEPAIEVNMPASSAEVHVMTTRFCLRREMGACLKTADAKKLPTKLYLRPTNTATRTMRIDCDCAACQMRLTALPL